MPCSTGNSYFCDECVPRGCSCNRSYFEEEDTAFLNKGGSYVFEHLIKYRTKFRIEDRKIGGEESPYLSHKYVVELDEQGREKPCCEYWDLRED